MLLKNIARAFVKHIGNAVGFGVVGDLAIDVWDSWSKEGQDQHQKLAEVQQIAQQSAAETREMAKAIALEVAADQSEEVQLRLQTYLTQVPAMVRQSMRRPADPTGTTVPPGLAMTKAEDLRTFLPAKPSRFKIGESPLSGVDWELVELLGVGGFGEVWKARNPYFDGVAPVALKFCLDPEASRTLRHEASVLNQVMRQGKHAGIVQLQHSYLSASPACLEYEYIQGGDLTGLIHDWHRSERFSAELAAAVMLQLAEIVGFAHRLNPPIVHRDLKPANILLQQGQGGSVQLKVADFGIGGVAASLSLEQAQGGTTSRGELMLTVMCGSHTPLYASPQQARGDLPDVRDDVHALGVIWYQLLTGDLSSGVEPGYDRDLRELGVNEQTIGLLGQCVDKPHRRPKDAAELASRLAVLLAAGVNPHAKAASAAAPMETAPPAFSQSPADVCVPAAKETLPTAVSQPTQLPVGNAPEQQEPPAGAVEVNVPGSWWFKKKANPETGWENVAETPGHVAIVDGEIYSLKVDPKAIDTDFAVLTDLANVSALAEIDLRGCKNLTDAGLVHLRSLSTIESLLLINCPQLTSEGLIHLSGLSRLEWLNLSGCKQLTDEALTHLRGLKSLKYLNLSGCKKLTGAGFAQLSGLPSLQRLWLMESNRITDKTLAHLSRLTGLRSLLLDKCKQVTDAGLAALGRLTGLTYLTLNDCKQVTDAGLALLSDMTSLEVLDLSGCEQITDAGLAHLHKLVALKSVDVSGCPLVTDEGMSVFNERKVRYFEQDVVTECDHCGLSQDQLKAGTVEQTCVACGKTFEISLEGEGETTCDHCNRRNGLTAADMELKPPSRQCDHCGKIFQLNWET